MPALTTERDTRERNGDLLSLAAAAGVVLFAGAMAALDGGGFATPGATAINLRGMGRVKETVDNSTGTPGDVTVEIEKGIFRFGNLGGPDGITAADIGNDCYMVDDQTVARNDGGLTRSVAGTVFDVDAQGVWVEFR